MSLPFRSSSSSVAAAFALGLLVVEASAQEAHDWLDRMNRAVEELSYQGTFVHVLGAAAETLRIVHRNDNGKIGERIVSLDGVGREIIRQEDEMQCILPDRRVVLLEVRRDLSPLVAALPSANEELLPHYELTMHGLDRVARRQTQVIGIKPRDAFRYGYMLWLDSKTAMPLKSQLTDEDGDIVEQILFTDIELSDSIPESALRPTTDTTGFEWLRPPESTELTSEVSPNVPWRAASLPGGFKLSAAVQSTIAGSDYPVGHLVYSDGLATVSVFIEDPNTQAEVGEGFSNVGSTNAYSLTLRGRKVTAVGEVPRRTVRTIASSLVAQ